MLRSWITLSLLMPCILMGVSPRLSNLVSNWLELGEHPTPQNYCILHGVLGLTFVGFGAITKGLHRYIYSRLLGDQCGCVVCYTRGTICGNEREDGEHCCQLCNEVLPDFRCNCPCVDCNPPGDGNVWSAPGYLFRVKLVMYRALFKMGTPFYLGLCVLPYLVFDCWSKLVAVADLIVAGLVMLVALVASPWVGVLLFVFGWTLAGVDAVCPHCKDQLPGCTGGETCAFVASQSTNALLATSTAVLAAGSAFQIGAMLPRSYLAVLTRGVLDSLLALTRRYLPGTSTSLTGKTVAELLQMSRDGSASRTDILNELGTLIVGGDADEREILRLAIDFVRAQQEVAKAGSSSNSGETVGLLRYLWAVTGKIAVRGSSTATITLEREAGVSGVQRLSEKIHRPVSMEQFSDMMFTFAAICHALGICNILLWASFSHEVVFEPLLTENYSWQFVHELLLVYLEDIDASTSLTFHSVVTDGSTDRRRRMAEVACKVHYPNANIFRSGGKRTGLEDADAATHNGRYTKTSKQQCQDWNAGKTCTRLHPNGTCKFNHVCNQWVTNKGKDGICGSTTHARHECDNPHKGPRQTQ